MTSYHFVIRSHGSLNMPPSFVLEYFCPSTRQSGYLASPFVLCTWYISGNCAAFLIRQPRFRVYNNKHIGMYHTCSSCLFWWSEKDEWALTVPDFLCSRLRSSQRKRKIGSSFFTALDFALYEPFQIRQLFITCLLPIVIFFHCVNPKSHQRKTYLWVLFQSIHWTGKTTTPFWKILLSTCKILKGNILHDKQP